HSGRSGAPENQGVGLFIVQRGEDVAEVGGVLFVLVDRNQVDAVVVGEFVHGQVFGHGVGSGRVGDRDGGHPVVAEVLHGPRGVGRGRGGDDEDVITQGVELLVGGCGGDVGDGAALDGGKSGQRTVGVGRADHRHRLLRLKVVEAQ